MKKQLYLKNLIIAGEIALQHTSTPDQKNI